jgi:hypothetical protein
MDVNYHEVLDLMALDSVSLTLATLPPQQLLLLDRVGVTSSLLLSIGNPELVD